MVSPSTPGRWTITTSARPPDQPSKPPEGWEGPWPPRLHIGPWDRLILRGRNPFRPVLLVRFERMRYAILGTALLVLLFAGVIAYSGQQHAKDICIDRNRTSVQYRRALEGLAAAAERRGDHESASIYRSLTPRAPLPSC